MKFNSWKLLNNFETDMFVNLYMALLFHFCNVDSFTREFLVMADALAY